jgi:hypothetical protein
MANKEGVWKGWSVLAHSSRTAVAALASVRVVAGDGNETIGWEVTCTSDFDTAAAIL